MGNYYVHWQPLVDENAHTALAFGFLRHAPVDQGLNPWLTEVLGRPTRGKPLSPEDFWPRYPSLLSGSHWTEPELVFDAHDQEAMKVIIEAKPGYGQQRREQITREIIDTARAEKASRIVCIMVGADLGAPMTTADWASHVDQELAAHGLSDVSCEVRYASWASLGCVAHDCAAAAPALQAYAEDVVEQLRLNVLMGYDGAPELDDLDGKFTITNAAEAFNRAVEAVRQFFLALHTASDFAALDLRPYGGRHRILRDGSSDSPTTPADFFETTVALSLYCKPSWNPEQVIFVAFDLVSDPDPQLQVGAARLTREGETIVYRWAHSDEPEGQLQTAALRDALRGPFPYGAVYDPGAEWVYDEQAWLPRRPDTDIAWAVSNLQTACAIWDTAVEREGA